MSTTDDSIDNAAASRAAIASIPLTDRDLLADAVQQTLSNGVASDTRREEYLRLLGALRKRSVRDRLIIALTGDGMDRDDAHSLVAAYADTVEAIGDPLDSATFATLVDHLADEGAEFEDAVRMARALAKRLETDAANAGGEMDRAPTRDELVEDLVSDGLVLAVATYAADLVVRYLGRTDGRLDMSETHDLTEVMLGEGMDPYRVREIVSHLTHRLRLNRDMRGPWLAEGSND